MEVTKVPKKIVTVIEPKRSMTVDKEKYRQKRVAAYCRVSTDSEEQLVSYANQKKVYTEMIASRKDWCFAGLFADEGKSGTRADKRPEFNKMINDCLAGKIDYIITKSVSRFARNTVDCLDYVRMLKSKGIGVYLRSSRSIHSRQIVNCIWSSMLASHSPNPRASARISHGASARSSRTELQCLCTSGSSAIERALTVSRRSYRAKRSSWNASSTSIWLGNRGQNLQDDAGREL